MKSKNRISSLIVCLLLLGINLSVYFFSMSVFKSEEIKYSYSDIIDTYVYFKDNRGTYIYQDRETVTEAILSLYGLSPTIIYEEDLGYNTAGMANPLINTIKIIDSQQYPRYATTLAHELEHINFVIKEYVANYNAIIKLWESENPFLRYAAGELAADILMKEAYISPYEEARQYYCINELVEYYFKNGIN